MLPSIRETYSRVRYLLSMLRVRIVAGIEIQVSRRQ